MKNPVTSGFIIFSGLLLLISLQTNAQKFTVEPVLKLPVEVRESSGLIFLNDKIITHNDSGDEAYLYEIDPESGQLIRRLVVDDASNGDWEDIAVDQQYIYIADIGNNKGNRENLRIYRISLLDYFQSSNDTVSSETILISYEDQVNFDSNTQTNFDAAAIISFQDSLYIFTKNWGDLHTNIYSVPKIPGEYISSRVGRINTEGLITGAVYNPLNHEIMMTGYTFIEPFLFRLSEFDEDKFDSGKVERLSYSVPGSFQIEGIETINEMDYYITSETNALGDATLLRVSTDFVVNTVDEVSNNLKVYPIPANSSVYISGLDFSTVRSIELFSTLGEKVFSIDKFILRSNSEITLDLNSITDGIYHMCIATAKTKIQRKLIVTPKRF